MGNERFQWLGELIYDINPTYVIDLGDGADMKSLNSYDSRNPQSVVTQNYQADIDVYNDSQEKLRAKSNIRKYKKPVWIGFEGNHENRIKKAIQHDPRVEGIVTAFLLVTYRQITGLMNIMNMLTRPHPSFTMMAYSMVIMFLVAILVLLCQLNIMAILLLKSWPVLQLSVIAINSITIIKLTLVLIRSMGLWLVVTKVKRNSGLDKLTESGVTEWSLKGK